MQRYLFNVTLQSSAGYFSMPKPLQQDSSCQLCPQQTACRCSSPQTSSRYGVHTRCRDVFEQLLLCKSCLHLSMSSRASYSCLGLQMEELKSSALSFIAQNFRAVADLSQDLAGLADSLLSRLAQVWCYMHACFNQDDGIALLTELLNHSTLWC